MPLTPLDIHNKEFRKSLRGYNEAEVDEFLDQVVREFESLLKENSALKERIETLSSKVEQYRRIEDAIHNTLVVAQQTAEEVKTNAAKEAGLMLKEASLKVEQRLHEAEMRLAAVSNEYDRLRNAVHLFRSRLKSLIKAHVELLEEQEDELPPQVLEAEKTIREEIVAVREQTAGSQSAADLEGGGGLREKGENSEDEEVAGETSST